MRSVVMLRAPVRGRRRVAVVVSADTMSTVFFFFNNRLGCLGSLLVSVIGTAVVVLVLVLINGR